MWSCMGIFTHTAPSTPQPLPYAKIKDLWGEDEKLNEDILPTNLLLITQTTKLTQFLNAQ